MYLWANFVIIVFFIRKSVCFSSLSFNCLCHHLRIFFENYCRCYRAFDPEGIVPSIATSASVWFGAFIGHILLATKNSTSERTKQMLPLAGGLAVLALILHFTVVPFNKNLYSMSYVLLMGGTAIGVLWLFYMLVDVFHYIKYAFFPLEWMGKNGMGSCRSFSQLFWWLSVAF